MKMKPLISRLKNNRAFISDSIPYSPARIYWIVAIAVFTVEIFIMYLLTILPEMSALPEAIFDSTLLVLLVSPVLFLFLFRPLTRHIAESAIIEDKLRKNKDMLQTVFDGISDPLMLLDYNLHVKMLNSAAIDYYGTDFEKIIDKPCYSAFKTQGMHCDECQISEAITSTRTIDFERQSALDPNRIEQVVIYRSQTKDGNPGAAIIRISDVTEAKNIERQMIQQEKMASLGLLISSVVHEINNPNNMISFNLPILKDYIEAVMPIVAASDQNESAIEHLNLTFSEFEKDIFDLLDNIDHGSNRINTIVSRLKEFSRIKKQKEMKHVDLNQVVKNVVSICNGEIMRYASSLKVEIPPDFPTIFTNAEYMEQILVNLLINASQASDKNDAWIRLNVTVGTHWDEHVIMEVSDNGCGMDNDTMKRIFDPLFTTKDAKNGTGLGLYVCHNLIENLGGRIEVESEPGEGSTFRVILTDEERRATKRLN